MAASSSISEPSPSNPSSQDSSQTSDLSNTPSPSQDLILANPDENDPFVYIPNIIAGFARSFVSQSMMALTGVSKGLLKWWFRVPVKLFRPSAVNPFLIFAAIAEQEGRRVSFGFVRNLFKVEGFALISKNMLPLLICNSIIGAVLFNTYSITLEILSKEVALPSFGGDSEEELTYEVKHSPFSAGALAGVAQSLLATPLDNVTRRVDPAEVANRRGEGVFRVMVQTVREAMPTEGGAWNKFKFLYHGYPVNVAKDALGFSLFFGMFETTRRIGKRFVMDVHDTYSWPKRYIYPTTSTDPKSLDNPSEEPKSRPSLSLTLGNVAAVVSAGSLAGMSYQLVAYPFERISQIIEPPTPPPTTIQNGREIPSYGGAPKPDWSAIWRTVRANGLSPFYKGIGAQLVRVAPPSAVGLLIFEIANSHLWED
ncbi:hypothetical protein HDU97_009028 [Phlyctochytrium planicorne]|nr:hypothetical protein HDU97_009028 [Phlyctochytrium planicorne]